MTIDLNITPLGNAISALQKAMERYDTEPDDMIRDACIQRFEFTYELSHRMLKRYLEATSANPDDIDSMTFQDLIRTGSERDLLRGEWPEWRNYRHARSITSHTYDEAKALEVFAIIPDFLHEARFLYDALRRGTG